MHLLKPLRLFKSQRTHEHEGRARASGLRLQPQRVATAILTACSLALLHPSSAIAQPEKSPTADRPASEELIVFMRSTDSPISERFEREHLPALAQEATRLGLDVVKVDVEAAGAPEGVHLTPLIVYQSARGRSIFQGRYADTGKVAHFVRTQRAVPPVSGTIEAEEAAVAEVGRARVLAPLKITSLAGHTPEDYDDDAFQSQAREAALAGFERFARQAKAVLGPSDRSFYMDFHPYRSEDDRLYVSVALFSQFNCIEPVFTAFDDPVSGPWSSRESVFARAAQKLEKIVFDTMRTSMIGDGFDAVPTTLPAPSWSALDLELPQAVAGAKPIDADFELPTRWRIEAAEGGAAPRLIFRFPPPLDRYSGEVRELDANLGLMSKDDLNGARGFVSVKTASVTMGEDSLDNALRGKMIFADRFPEANFDLQEATADQKLAFGRISRLVATGTFKMMGIEIPLDVRAQVEPIIGEDGAPRLHVQAGFEIRLQNPFGIAGPDGPAPANDTLNFHLNFLLEGTGESSAK